MQSDSHPDNVTCRQSRIRPWLARIILLTLSTLFALVLAETGLRFYARSNQSSRREKLSKSTHFVPRQGETRLGHIIRPAVDSEIVYELIPNVSTIFKHQELHVNAAGFRGPECSPSKPPRTVRILGIGDSVMFGWGVAEDKTYLALLAARLNVRYPEVNWEVVNTAVPGYNTAMEAAVLESKGLAYDPDIVIVGYVPNDLGLPNFLLPEVDAWSLSKSHLFELLRNDFRALRQLTSDGLTPTPADLRGRNDEHRVPEAYRHMVGPDGYRNAMQRIRKLSQQHGFELLALSHLDNSPHREEVRRINQQLGISFLSAEDRLEAYMNSQAIDDRAGSELTISADDPHPSDIWHDIVCTALLEYLDVNDLIQHRMSLVIQRGQELANSRTSHLNSAVLPGAQGGRR